MKERAGGGREEKEHSIECRYSIEQKQALG